MSDLRIAGYASVFNIIDKGGDIVRKGAFAAAALPMPLLWQHEAREPIGFVERFSEDERGLRVVARLVDAGRGAAAAALVRARAIDGLSFGYRVKQGRSQGGSGRELAALELIEVSLVTFPMQPLARILGFSSVAEETMNDL